MCITGYTCNDLFLQDTLLSDAQKSLATITEYTKGKNMLTVVGLPFEYCNKLYNVAAVIKDGVILGLVPKNIFLIITNSMKDVSLQRALTRL